MIDNRQFEQLFKSNYAAMVRMARSMLGDDEESKDVVSDIMLRVGDGRIALPPDSQRYLLACVRNRCLDVIQHKKTTEKILRLYPLAAQPTLNIANDQQVYDEILHVVETQLTPQTRKVFELRHDRHFSYQEIADTLDISKAAVYKHLAKAITLLRAHFIHQDPPTPSRLFLAHNAMDKITQLLDIIEHPEKYSDENLEKMLSDEQLSQYYEVMALASNAYRARRAKEHEPDDVDAAWKEFQARNTVSTIHHQWWRSAAIIIGIMVSGLAIAALWPFWHTEPKAEPIEMTQQTKPISADSSTPKENQSHSEPQSLPTAQNIVFDNVTLEQIIRETSEFYGMSYSFDREEPRLLRLHVKWNQQQPMDSFVSRLNRFEKFNIIIDDNTIIIQ